MGILDEDRRRIIYISDPSNEHFRVFRTSIKSFIFKDKRLTYKGMGSFKMASILGCQYSMKSSRIQTSEFSH